MKTLDQFLGHYFLEFCYMFVLTLAIVAGVYTG